MSVLSKPYFHDEEAAYAFVEARVWPEGPVCPRCKGSDRVGKLKGKTTRIGTYKCYACRKPFTVKVGTVMESSHLPMTVWLQAMYLMASSKKGISANQLHRTLGITLKSAWFLSHRIREAMRALKMEPIGGGSEPVEADETFIGRDPNKKKRRGYAHKHAVLSLVERNGQVRSRHVPNVRAETLKPILREQIKADTILMTDEARQYGPIGKDFFAHLTVEHGIGEYVRGGVHTNTVEGYFSVFKRGMKGVYQHCSERHLKRYLAEFDFRYNMRTKLGYDDETRAEAVVAGIVGKRLTYHGSPGVRG